MLTTFPTDLYINLSKMHKCLFSVSVLLDGIKKRSAEDKFTCPNCREENFGTFPVCRLTEYLKGESIQGDDKDQKSCKMLIFLSISIASRNWAYFKWLNYLTCLIAVCMEVCLILSPIGLVVYAYRLFCKMSDMNVEIYLWKLHFGSLYVFRAYSGIKVLSIFCLRVSSSR